MPDDTALWVRDYFGCGTLPKPHCSYSFAPWCATACPSDPARYSCTMSPDNPRRRFQRATASQASTLFFALLLGLAFGCKENPRACRQNLGGDQCCTDKSDRPNSFYCDDGHTTEYVGGDCNRVIFGIAAGRTVRCCEKESEEDKAAGIAIIVGAIVGGVAVLILIIVLIMKTNVRVTVENTGNANTAGSPPPPIQQAVPVQHAIEMPVMQATQQPPRGARFDPQTGQPIPKFDPITGVQNWFD